MSTKRTNDIDGYRIEISGSAAIWWTKITRLSDLVTFESWELFGRSFATPEQAMQRGEGWVRQTVKAKAYFDRVTHKA